LRAEKENQKLRRKYRGKKKKFKKKEVFETVILE